MTISGGHTQIVKVSNFFEMEVLGETIDDAVGEAYDKSGKVLGLGYPAGPEIDKLAQLGNPKAFRFTKPKVDGLNFSFSGLKTAILYFVQRETKKNPDFIKENDFTSTNVDHTYKETVYINVRGRLIPITFIAIGFIHFIHNKGNEVSH